MKDEWSEREVDYLREAIKKGYSSGLVARNLKRTRNAVLDKANRLGLKFEPKYRLPGDRSYDRETIFGEGVPAVYSSLRHEPWEWRFDSKRKSEAPTLERERHLLSLPYRNLSGVHIRRIIDRMGKTPAELAAQWGVSETEVRFRAGLV